MRNISFVILLLVYIPSQAQLAIGCKSGIGISAGSFKQNNYRDEFKVGFIPAFNIGAVAEAKVGDMFGLLMEMTYSSKGTLVKRNGVEYIKNKHRLNYIDFPLLLTTKFEIESKRFFAGFGPTLSYWLNGSGVVRGEELEEWDLERLKYNLIVQPEKINAEDDVLINDFNSLQFSLSFCFGHEMKMREGQKLLISLKYDAGHTFLSNTKEVSYPLGSYSPDFRSNNQVISLSAYYLFDFNTLRRNLAK